MIYSDAYLKSVLQRTRVIACVGVSANPVRPSYYVARYLGLKGYRVIPINPAMAGGSILGERVLASLTDIPADASVDMVDIFRRPEFVPEIVDTALKCLPSLRTVWMQIGVTHAEATAQANARGIDVIQDRCPKMEHQRLFGELRKAGINTGIISSRL